jgi:hypothetical protein
MLSARAAAAAEKPFFANAWTASARCGCSRPIASSPPAAVAFAELGHAQCLLGVEQPGFGAAQPLAGQTDSQRETGPDAVHRRDHDVRRDVLAQDHRHRSAGGSANGSAREPQGALQVVQLILRPRAARRADRLEQVIGIEAQRAGQPDRLVGPGVATVQRSEEAMREVDLGRLQ